MNEKWDDAIIALQEHIEKRLYHGLDLSDVPSCKAAIVLLQKARVVTREDVLRHTAGFAVESVAEVLIELGELL